MEMPNIVRLYGESVIDTAKKTGIIPAGWYDSEVVGAHEGEHTFMRLISLDRDEPRENIPDFTYWYEETPISELYRLSRAHD